MTQLSVPRKGYVLNDYQSAHELLLDCFTGAMSHSACTPTLFPINKLRLDALRRLLLAHVAGERVHQRAQISELADGTRMAGASCNCYFVHGITRLQRRSCRH